MKTEISCPLFVRATTHPDAPAVLFGRRTFTYGELDRYVWGTIEQMTKLGLRTGSRVGVCAHNSWELVVVLFSLWRMGCVSVLLSHRLPPQAVNHELSGLRCEFLLTNISGLTASSGMIGKSFQLQDVVMFGAKGGKGGRTVHVSVDQPLTVVFTSGSQGQAKAALLSFGNFYFNALGANENMPFGPGDRWLLSLPLFHVGGLGILWRSLIGGGSVVIPDGGEDWSVIIRDKAITHLSLVPTQLFRLMRESDFRNAIQSVKAILMGGAPMPVALLEKAVSAGIPIHISYGLTEMASQVATSSRLVWGDRDSFCPKTLPHCAMMLTDAGEILVKGKTLFLGYITSHGLERPLDHDGWFATGDQGEMDQDGGLKVKGRKDNMFLSGGENIQPEEIEGCLLRCPGVQEAVVIPSFSEEFGAVPICFVKIDPMAPLSYRALTAHLQEQLPKFKIPRAFYHWPQTMMSGELKIRRSALLSFFEKYKDELDLMS